MKQTIVKTYKGTQEKASAAFATDAEKMAAQGYYPSAQTWAPGSYGCASFVFALLLCFLLIGIVIFIYMLIVKPAGTLTVTYTLQSAPVTRIAAAAPSDDLKTCPICAETVKAAAIKCRFCGHEFGPPR